MQRKVGLPRPPRRAQHGDLADATHSRVVGRRGIGPHNGVRHGQRQRIRRGHDGSRERRLQRPGQVGIVGVHRRQRLADRVDQPGVRPSQCAIDGRAPLLPLGGVRRGLPQPDQRGQVSRFDRRGALRPPPGPLRLEIRPFRRGHPPDRFHRRPVILSRHSAPPLVRPPRRPPRPPNPFRPAPPRAPPSARSA